MEEATCALRVLFVTAPPADAPALGRTLVEERLVACANVLPGATSFYWWQGALCRDEEAVLWMETTAGRLEAATARLREIHPYEVPKIVAFTPAAVHGPYAAWVHAETSPRDAT